MIQITSRTTNTIHLNSLNRVKVTLLLPLVILFTTSLLTFTLAGDDHRSSSLNLNRQLNHQLSPSTSSSSSSSSSPSHLERHFDIEKKLLHASSFPHSSTACDNVVCGPNSECVLNDDESVSAPTAICKCKTGFSGDASDLTLGCKKSSRIQLMCEFKNKSYGIEESFYDGCTSKCVCSEALEVDCEPRCPEVEVPKSDEILCTLVEDPKDSCCKVLACESGTIVHKAKASSSPSPSSSFTSSSSSSSNTPTSGRGSFSTNTGDNQSSNVSSEARNEHEVDTVSPPLGSNSDDVVTSLEDDSGNSAHSTTGDGSGSCIHGNKSYQVGQVFFDGCAYRCTCRTGGIRECEERCPVYIDTVGYENCEWQAAPDDACCIIPVCDGHNNNGNNSNSHLDNKSSDRTSNTNATTFSSSSPSIITSSPMSSASSSTSSSSPVVAVDATPFATSSKPLAPSTVKITTASATSISSSTTTTATATSTTSTTSTKAATTATTSTTGAVASSSSPPISSVNAVASQNQANKPNSMSTSPPIAPAGNSSSNHSSSSLGNKRNESASSLHPSSPSFATSSSSFPSSSDGPVDSLADTNGSHHPSISKTFTTTATGSSVLNTELHGDPSQFDQLSPFCISHSTGQAYTVGQSWTEGTCIKKTCRCFQVKTNGSTAVECKGGCASIPASALIATPECPKPQLISPNDACLCPYVVCSGPNRQQQQQQTGGFLGVRPPSIVPHSVQTVPHVPHSDVRNAPTSGTTIGNSGGGHGGLHGSSSSSSSSLLPDDQQGLNKNRKVSLRPRLPFASTPLESDLMMEEHPPTANFASSLPTSTNHKEKIDLSFHPHPPPTSDGNNNFNSNNSNDDDESNLLCQFKGRKLARGEEVYDNCHSVCHCGNDGQLDCALIECPHHFSSHSSGCLEWELEPNFVPSPPSCCPKSRCKSEGSCLFAGVKVENYKVIPSDLLPCGTKCICVNGNITCENRCPVLPDVPPASLPCAHHLAYKGYKNGDSCCLAWLCRESDRAGFCMHNGVKRRVNEEWEESPASSSTGLAIVTAKRCRCRLKASDTETMSPTSSTTTISKAKPVIECFPAQCPPITERHLRPSPECPVPVVIAPDDPSIVCPYVVCNHTEETAKSLEHVSLVATNATSVRVRFTLPQILVGLIGHAELHYTSNALIPRYEWNVQKFARPNRLFDTPNIEYHLNNLKSDTTYYFQIKVLVEALQSGPESDVYKLKMPSLLSSAVGGTGAGGGGGSGSSSPGVSSILPSSNSISPSVTSTASTTTLPPVILIDARISAAISDAASDLPASRGGPVINGANEVSVTVTWRPLDKKEKRLIDAIQVKYRKIDESESTAKVSGLIHRDLTSHTLRHLQPGASYLIDLLFKPDESIVTSSTTLVSSKPIVVELPLVHRNQLDLLSPLLPLDVQNDLHVEGTRVIFKLPRSLPRPVNKFVTVVKITYRPLTRDGSSDLTGGLDDGSDNDHPGPVDNNDEHLMSRDSRGAGGTSHSSSSSSSASSSSSSSSLSLSLSLSPSLSPSSSSSASSSSSPSSPSSSSGSDSLHHSFKQPSEDGHILLEGLLPRRKYRAWIECYLVNGRISSSGAIDFTTKDATASRSDGTSKKASPSPDEDPSEALNEALASETSSSKSSSTPGNQLLNSSHSVKSDELKPYYLALTIVALFAALTSIAFLSLLCIMLRSKSSAKAPITRGSPSPIGSATCDQAYDNPSYKSCEGDLTNAAIATALGPRTNGGTGSASGGGVSVNGTTNIRLNGLTTSSLTMSSNCNSNSPPTPSHPTLPSSSSPSSLNSSSTADSNNSNVLNSSHHHLHHSQQQQQHHQHHNNLNLARLATSNHNSSVSSHNNQGSHHQSSQQQQLHLHQIHLSHRPNGSNNGSSSIKLNGLNAGSAIIGSAQV